jgi:hypothetical protein
MTRQSSAGNLLYWMRGTKTPDDTRSAKVCHSSREATDVHDILPTAVACTAVVGPKHASGPFFMVSREVTDTLTAWARFPRPYVGRAFLNRFSLLLRLHEYGMCAFARTCLCQLTDPGYDHVRSDAGHVRQAHGSSTFSNEMLIRALQEIELRSIIWTKDATV